MLGDSCDTRNKPQKENIHPGTIHYAILTDQRKTGEMSSLKIKFYHTRRAPRKEPILGRI
jgi:hypothetical protein